MLTSDVDVSVALADWLKDPQFVARKLHIFKEKGRLNCVIKPKAYLGIGLWNRINSWVHQNGGEWHPKEGLWTVPLQRKTHH